MRSLFVSFLLIFSVMAGVAASADVRQHASARLYSPSDCSYFSRSAAEVMVFLDGFDFPRYSKVTMIWGVELYNQSNQVVTTWNEKKETLPYRYSGENNSWFYHLEDITYAARSSPLMARAIKYVFKVELYDGGVEWRKGNNSALGYYRLDISKLPLNCRKESPWENLTIENVSKDN